MSYFDKNKFEYYYNSFKNGTYFGVVPDEEGMEKVKDLIKKLKLKSPIEEEKIHVTLMYSEDKGNPLIPPSSDLVYEAKPVSFALFGPEKNCLVVKLESADLQARHNELLANGFIHSYDDYSPHITLSYDYDGELPDSEKLKDLGMITFSNEYTQAIEDNWS